MTQVVIKPQTVCCPAHGEHMRPHWPAGAITVALTLVDYVLADEAFQRACGADLEADPPRMASTARMNDVLAVKPLCYWVPRQVIRSAFMEAGIMRIGRCQNCRRSGPGGEYQVATPRGTRTLWWCLECALSNGEGMHRARPNGNVWPR